MDMAHHKSVGLRRKSFGTLERIRKVCQRTVTTLVSGRQNERMRRAPNRAFNTNLFGLAGSRVYERKSIDLPTGLTARLIQPNCHRHLLQLQPHVSWIHQPPLHDRQNCLLSVLMKIVSLEAQME
jgi:hypothetical protein